MIFKGDEVIFESTGRQENIWPCRSPHFSPNGKDGVCYGDDGGFDDLTDAEVIEITIYMIQEWMTWMTTRITKHEH